MFTDIMWDDNNEFKKKKGNSFVFRYFNDEIYIHKHKGKELEVFHSKTNVFTMDGGPFAINQDGRTANAFLGKFFKVSSNGTDRKTILCGEEQPELQEVMIYQLFR